MSFLVGALGGGIVLLALLDLMITTVSAGRGAGPLTGRIARGAWAVLRWLQRSVGSSKPLVAGGPLILLGVIANWVLLLILGWSLVFGSPEVLQTVGGEQDSAVPILSRVRYAAAIIIGRGGAAVQPSGGIYEVLEPLAALTGLAVLSLSIAYALSVVRGVVEKRALAQYVSALGTRPAQILKRAWNGSDFGDLNLHVIALVPRITSVAQSHLAYPIIHYFHSSDRRTALGPSIVALDEALTANGLLDDEVAMKRTAVKPLRHAITDFLETLHLAFITPADVDVDEGDERMQATMAELDDVGIEIADDARRELSEEEVGRNRLLRGYLVHDGWGDADALDVTRDGEVAAGDQEAEARDDPDAVDGVDERAVGDDATGHDED